MKLTRQGVRDLNPPGHRNPARARRRVVGCLHLFVSEDRYDCFGDFWRTVRRCTLCHEVRP